LHEVLLHWRSVFALRRYFKRTLFNFKGGKSKLDEEEKIAKNES